MGLYSIEAFLINNHLYTQNKEQLIYISISLAYDDKYTHKVNV